ncbi:hypothetical protein PUN28_000812 [Cardiocondyla obscurior]|uniref:G patch domain-containing protein 11 n=1 Tax=Cardiocondyla obscurior TaxID=286306 RepID=A0AAW2H170_9HYME
MSDDEDYMSDKFLQTCQQTVSPSLLHKHSDRRQFKIMKKKAEIEARMKKQTKLLKAMEAQKREEGLLNAIASDNKGFEILLKMGYTPGQGIGKDQSGITEPITINVKTNKHGLGDVPNKKKKLHNNTTSKETNNIDTNEFRSRMAQGKMEQMYRTDLYKSQKVCQELNIKDNIEKPDELWYWPETKEEEEEEEEEDDESDNDKDDESLSDLQKLHSLTTYLRTKYLYCIWCATKFDDLRDLRDNCPGNTREDH